MRNMYELLKVFNATKDFEAIKSRCKTSNDLRYALFVYGFNKRARNRLR